MQGSNRPTRFNVLMSVCPRDLENGVNYNWLSFFLFICYFWFD